MIIVAGEQAKEERKKLKGKGHKIEDLGSQSILEECEVLTEFIDETKMALLIFKRFELSLELIVQLSIHMTILLLEETKYPIESGLEGFQQEYEINESDKVKSCDGLILAMKRKLRFGSLDKIH